MKQGDTDYIAKVATQARDEQRGTNTALTGVVSHLESALADVARALENPSQLEAIRQVLASFESSLADLVRHAEEKEPLDLAPLVDAIKGLKLTAPDVKVNVAAAPTPEVHVEAVMPQQPAPVVHNHINVPPAPEQKSATWEVRIAQPFGGPDKIMTITRKT